MTADTSDSNNADVSHPKQTLSSSLPASPQPPSPPPAKRETSNEIIVHFMVGFREICLVTAALPLVTLFISFVGAVIFQAEETHETHCQVFNFIPSISAITGVSPQRYFWRISIALHVGPRFIIAICYKNYYVYLLQSFKDQIALSKGTLLMNVAFWLHVIEITSLCGVTYVSNRENYNLHEQVFIVFITCSLGHMLVTIKMCQLIRQHINAVQHPQLVSDNEEISLKWKQILFALSVICTIGLVVFFFKHRVYCHDLAFSAFAFCEYVVAIANLAFHCTTVLDFPSEYLMIARGSKSKIKLHQPLGWKMD